MAGRASGLKKNCVMWCWCGYLSGARCRLAYGPADATVSCFSKIQVGYTSLVPAHLGSPGKRAIKRTCVCACVRACVRVCFWGNYHVGLGKENDCARLHWDFHRLDAILSPCIKSLCTVFLSLLFMYCFYLVLMKGYFCGGHIWACPDCPWSIFSTLFGRWHQQCSLLLSVLHHLVDIFYTFCLY